MPRKTKQLDMFALFGTQEEGLEKTVSEEARQPDLTKNNAEHFGIKKGHLTGLEYNTLKDVFYGMNQFSAPKQMLAAMNPTEILALYAGIQGLKERFIRDVKLPENTVFENLVSAMVSKPLEVSGTLAYQHNRSRKIYPAEPGALKKRMAALPSETKLKFMNLLEQPRRYSNAEKTPAEDFYDPNCDGHSVKVYVNAILRMI